MDKKLNIALVCNLGSSTSILVEKMKTVAAGSQALKDWEINITSFPVASLEDNLQGTDIVFLAPQVSHQYDKVSEVAEQKGVKVSKIEPSEYGTMDAAGLLKRAISLTYKAD